MANRLENGRFKRKPNKYLERGGYMVGITSKGQEFYFDKIDYDRVSELTWYIENNGYPRARKPDGKNVQLHRYILQPSVNEDVDHKYHDPVNCKRDNIRICSTSQNMMNMKKTTKQTSSIYKGVHCSATGKRRKRWSANIRSSGKLFSLGYFLTEEEAALAYDQKAKELFGEYAYLNVVGGDSHR